MRKGKKILASCALMICLVLTSTTAMAASCPPHGSYVDRVLTTNNWTTNHTVSTGYGVDGKPIYRNCVITNWISKIAVVCTKCGTQVGSYEQSGSNHSVSHN